MTQQAELHLLKQRVAELEETVETLDRGLGKKELALRDKFAMAAITPVGLSIKDTAERAYQIADAMMEARSK